MAAVVAAPTVTLTVTITLTEDEARALEAIAGYDDAAIVAAVYNGLGRSYVEPYEKGLRSFFASIRREIPALLQRTDRARRAFRSPA